jgi:hypothetical protein
MPRNIEIKARIDATLNDLIERIQPIADGPPRYFTQNDTFFSCPSGGRLKLRIEQVEIIEFHQFERTLHFIGFFCSINLL